MVQEEGREGRKGEKKKQRLVLQQRTYNDSKTRAAMENVRILGTSHIASIPSFSNEPHTAPKSSSD